MYNTIERKTDRQERIPHFSQEAIKDTKIAVIGAGATGNEVLKCLALTGFRYVFITDMDHISTSNLSRTVLFNESDVGKRKAVTAADRFCGMCIDDSPAADYFDGDLCHGLGEGVIRHCDIVIGCVDNDQTRLFVSNICQLLGKPYIDTGIGGLNWNVFPTSGKEDCPCYALDSIEVDVLTILNTDNTPIYLRKPYGKMRPGCIYLRKGDRNTPDNSNALFGDIEMLWKKRFRLTKPPLEYIKNHLNNPLEWNETQDCYYNIFRPEYVLEHVYDESDRDLRAEFYAYAMTNEHVVYSSIVVKCSGTIVDNYQIVALDGGRYTTPTPEWGFLGKRLTENGPEFSYKYFLKDSFRYSLHSFMYHEENGEERYAHDDLMDIVLLFDSVDEKNEFERYVEYHIQNLRDRVDAQNEYSYVRADSEAETRFIIHRLRIARVLQSILKEYREWVKNHC